MSSCEFFKSQLDILFNIIIFSVQKFTNSLYYKNKMIFTKGKNGVTTNFPLTVFLS